MQEQLSRRRKCRRIVGTIPALHIGTILVLHVGFADTKAISCRPAIGAPVNSVASLALAP